jgi:CRP-like cAMP-binding protein
MASSRPVTCGSTNGPHRLAVLGADDAAAIRAWPLFADVDAACLARLLAGAMARRYDRNAVLFLAGEPACRLFAVLEGRIRLFNDAPDGHESTIGILDPGEAAGVLGVLERDRYRMSCSVITRSRLLTIPAGAFLTELRHSPELAHNLLIVLARQLRQLAQQVEQLTYRTSLQRLADFLLHLCPPGEASAEIKLPLDKMLVAARLGMQPETLSRSLARLRAAGVHAHGRHVLVNDVANLERLAGCRRDP